MYPSHDVFRDVDPMNQRQSCFASLLSNFGDLKGQQLFIRSFFLNLLDRQISDQPSRSVLRRGEHDELPRRTQSSRGRDGKIRRWELKMKSLALLWKDTNVAYVIWLIWIAQLLRVIVLNPRELQSNPIASLDFLKLRVSAEIFRLTSE